MKGKKTSNKTERKLEQHDMKETQRSLGKEPYFGSYLFMYLLNLRVFTLLGGKHYCKLNKTTIEPTSVSFSEGLRCRPGEKGGTQT